MINEKNYYQVRQILIDDKENYKIYSEEHLIKPMRLIIDYFTKHGVTIWCSDGTSLGLYRNRKLIDGDEDIDLSIDISTLNRNCVEGLPEFLSSIGFQLKGGTEYVNNYVLSYKELLRAFDEDVWFPFRNFKFVSNDKFSFKDGLELHAEIDIFCHYPIGGNHYKSVFPCFIRKYDADDIVKPYVIDTQYGKFPLPRRPEVYMRFTYGEDWHIPKVVNYSAHKQETVFENRLNARKFGDIRWNFKRNEGRILSRKFWKMHTCLTEEQLFGINQYQTN